MRVLLLHSPGAGSGNYSARALKKLFKEEGHEVVYCDVKKEGIEPEEAEKADLIAVGGGDGTVGKAIWALADVDRPFVILPLGTANNIARCLGLFQSPEQIVEQCTGAPERRLDLGLTQGPWGRTMFLEGVGLGALAKLGAVGDATDQDSDEKERFGVEAPPRFVREAEPGCWRLRADGRELPRGLLLVEMLNMPQVGPKLPLGPEGWPEDGQIYVTFLRPEGREAFAAWLEGRRERPAPGIETVVAEQVTFEWTGGPLRIDDHFPEAPSGTVEVTVEMMRRKLRILVPSYNGGNP